jgi:zinc transporter 1/2/3
MYQKAAASKENTDHSRYCYLPDGKETPFTTYASSQTASPATATASATSETTAASTTEPEALPATVSGCHPHGTILFCMVNGEEYEVKEGVEDVASAPKSFSGCHGHGEEL